jgi:hypothetical protein
MQQFRLIDPFKSAVYVSGDNFAHPQEHFDCIYSFWCDTPTLLSTGVTGRHLTLLVAHIVVNYKISVKNQNPKGREL